MNTADVAYRSGAIVSPEMVRLVGARASAVAHAPPDGAPQLVTHLVARVWVKNVAYTKYVWADVHVFDRAGAVIASVTHPLRYAHSPDDGDLFELDEPVHRAAAPDGTTPARRVQYRVYYEVNGQVFTDNVLHYDDVEPDGGPAAG